VQHSTPKTPGQPTLSQALRGATHGPFSGASPAPWLDDDRPPAPNTEALWDDRAGEWIDLGSDVRPLDQVAPAPGVGPGARARHKGTGRWVPWRILEDRLEGVHLRRGRGGAGWLWDPSRSALETMEHLYQQTARAADVGRADVREPSWLRDPRWGLSPRELRLIAVLVSVYEAGWGGLYDCASTVAIDLSIGSERTLRNLLWGQTWKTRGGETRVRPGLVERGFVRVAKTWRPGSRDQGRPSDQHWNLLRLGPAVDRCAAWGTLAKTWTRRAPRGSGWGRRRARVAVRRLRSSAARSRFRCAGVAWSARPGRDGEAAVELADDFATAFDTTAEVEQQVEQQLGDQVEQQVEQLDHGVELGDDLLAAVERSIAAGRVSPPRGAPPSPLLIGRQVMPTTPPPGDPLRVPPRVQAQEGSGGGLAPPPDGSPPTIELASLATGPSTPRTRPRRGPSSSSRPAIPARARPAGSSGGPPLGPVFPRQTPLGASTAGASGMPTLDECLASNAAAGGFAASLDLRTRQALGFAELDVEPCCDCDGTGRLRRPRVGLDDHCVRCRGRGEV